MPESDAEAILLSRYAPELVSALLGAYREIESNYFVEKWKPSELDAGHFVEASRRVLEFELFGTFTPVAEEISKFNETAMKRYEGAKGDDSYRILIPRALHAIYAIRNKRGVGHLGGVSPNEMDATFILYTVKWVLAEIVRLSSGLSIPETQRAVDAIVERHLPALWKHDDFVRVLNPTMTARDQVLVHLYDKDSQTEVQLREAIEYSNAGRFRKAVLSDLHKRRLIFWNPNGGCLISPTGRLEAERIILQQRGNTTL